MLPLPPVCVCTPFASYAGGRRYRCIIQFRFTLRFCFWDVRAVPHSSLTRKRRKGNWMEGIYTGTINHWPDDDHANERCVWNHLSPGHVSQRDSVMRLRVYIINVSVFHYHIGHCRLIILPSESWLRRTLQRLQSTFLWHLAQVSLPVQQACQGQFSVAARVLGRNVFIDDHFWWPLTTQDDFSYILIYIYIII